LKINRLKNVPLTEVKELKIEQPPIKPDEELALQNRKTITEIKQIEGNLEAKVWISYQVSSYMLVLTNMINNIIYHCNFFF
jgi:hypothetical protein